MDFDDEGPQKNYVYNAIWRRLAAKRDLTQFFFIQCYQNGHTIIYSFPLKGMQLNLSLQHQREHWILRITVDF